MTWPGILLLAGFLLPAAALRAQTVTDNFESATPLTNPLAWVVDTNAATPTIATDGGSHALELAQNQYAGTDLPTAFTLNATNPLIFSFSFHDTGNQELRIGLYNNKGTAVGTASGAVAKTNMNNDQGIFVDINPVAVPPGETVSAQDGSTDTVFYGTRASGSAHALSVGTSTHLMSLQLLLVGTNIQASFYMDGSLVGTDLFTASAYGQFIGTNGITNIDLVDINPTGGTGNIYLDNISVSMVPEPSAGRLLGIGLAAFLFLGAFGLKRKESGLLS